MWEQATENEMLQVADQTLSNVQWLYHALVNDGMDEWDAYEHVMELYKSPLIRGLMLISAAMTDDDSKSIMEQAWFSVESDMTDRFFFNS